MNGIAFALLAVAAFYAGYGASAWADYHPRWWFVKYAIVPVLMAIPLLETFR